MKKYLKLLFLISIITMSIANSNAQKCFTGSEECKFYTTNCAKRTVDWAGECKNGFIDGKGELKVYEEGKLHYTLNGEIRNGKPNGFCTLNFVGWGVEKGQYINGDLNGPGEWKLKDGSSYIGNFKDNEIHGVGVYTYPDGRIHDGMSKEGEMEGECVFYWPDGSKWEGIIDKKNPKAGIYYDKSGSIKKGWDYYSVVRAKDNNEAIETLLNFTLSEGVFGFFSSSCYECESCGNGKGGRKSRSKNVTLECENGISTKWTISHVITCTGTRMERENYIVTSSEITQRRLTFNSESSAVSYINSNSNRLCQKGEKVSDDHFEKMLLNKLKELPDPMPPSNVEMETISQSSWVAPKRGEGSIAFYEGDKAKYWTLSSAPHKTRYGSYIFYPKIGYIAVNWKPNNSLPEEFEILSIVEYDKDKYKLYSSSKNQLNVIPILSNRIKEGEEKKEYYKLFPIIGRDGFELLEYCGVCYWKDKVYQKNEKVYYDSRFYGKKLEFTCNIENNKAFWISEHLEDPYFYDPNLEYCLSCKIGWGGAKRNSPGFYKEDTDGDPYYGIVYKSKEGKVQTKVVMQKYFYKYRDLNKK